MVDFRIQSTQTRAPILLPTFCTRYHRETPGPLFLRPHRKRHGLYRLDADAVLEEFA
jgi:hypothetical protein